MKKVTPNVTLTDPNYSPAPTLNLLSNPLYYPNLGHGIVRRFENEGRTYYSLAFYVPFEGL